MSNSTQRFEPRLQPVKGSRGRAIGTLIAGVLTAGCQMMLGDYELDTRPVASTEPPRTVCNGSGQLVSVDSVVDCPTGQSCYVVQGVAQCAQCDEAQCVDDGTGHKSFVDCDQMTGTLKEPVFCGDDECSLTEGCLPCVPGVKSRCLLDGVTRRDCLAAGGPSDGICEGEDGGGFVAQCIEKDERNAVCRNCADDYVECADVLEGDTLSRKRISCVNGRVFVADCPSGTHCDVTQPQCVAP